MDTISRSNKEPRPVAGHRRLTRADRPGLAQFGAVRHKKRPLRGEFSDSLKKGRAVGKLAATIPGEAMNREG